MTLELDTYEDFRPAEEVEALVAAYEDAVRRGLTFAKPCRCEDGPQTIFDDDGDPTCLHCGKRVEIA